MQSPPRHVRSILEAPRPVRHDALRGTGSSQPAMRSRLAAILGTRLANIWLISILIIGVPTLVLLFLRAPHSGMLLLLALLVWIAWRWARVEIAVHTLATQLDQGEALGKLEVERGAWGVVCHAVNQLVQQQRLFQRSQTLLPALPADMMNGLLDGQISTTQTPCAATVLLIGCRNRPDHQERSPATEWDALATLAQEVATPHNALIQRCGDGLLLVFGLGRQSFTTPGVRAAFYTTLALQQRWAAADAGNGRLNMVLTTGPLVAGAVTGLGYGVIGWPIAQAQALYELAKAHPEYAALCDDGAYVALRQLGVEVKMMDQQPLHDSVSATAYVVAF